MVEKAYCLLAQERLAGQAGEVPAGLAAAFAVIVSQAEVWRAGSAQSPEAGSEPMIPKQNIVAERETATSRQCAVEAESCVLTDLLQMARLTYLAAQALISHRVC